MMPTDRPRQTAVSYTFCQYMGRMFGRRFAAGGQSVKEHNPEGESDQSLHCLPIQGFLG